MKTYLIVGSSLCHLEYSHSRPSLLSALDSLMMLYRIFACADVRFGLSWRNALNCSTVPVQLFLRDTHFTGFDKQRHTVDNFWCEVLLLFFLNNYENSCLYIVTLETKYIDFLGEHV